MVCMTIALVALNPLAAAAIELGLVDELRMFRLRSSCDRHECPHRAIPG
jgi:hypothetical protein